MARDPWTRRYDYPQPRPRREDDEPIIRPTSTPTTLTPKEPTK